MAVSVVHIRNTLIRRVTLVIVFVPVVVIGTLIHLIKQTWKCAVDAEKAFESAWRGY